MNDNDFEALDEHGKRLLWAMWLDLEQAQLPGISELLAFFGHQALTERAVRRSRIGSEELPATLDRLEIGGYIARREEYVYLMTRKGLDTARQLKQAVEGGAFALPAEAGPAGDMAPDPEIDELWKVIPEHNWDRAAVMLWNKGYSYREIGNKIGVNQKTAQNRIGELRRQFPSHVLTDKERRRLRSPEVAREKSG